MAEHVKIEINNGPLFDRCVHNSLPEGGDLMIVTKNNATKGGMPAACVTFSAELPDGTILRVQCVTTVRNLIAALTMLATSYQDEPGVKAFVDTTKLPEDERIRMIGESVMSGNVVGFVVDSLPGKADRYIAKLLTRFPELEVVARFDGPVANTHTIKVRKKAGCKMEEKPRSAAITSLTKADLETVVNSVFDKLEAKLPSLLTPAEERLRAVAIKLIDDVAADLGIVS